MEKKERKGVELKLGLDVICVYAVIYLFLLAGLAGCYIFGWSLLSDTKEYYVSMLGTPSSANPCPWSLIFAYAFMGYAPVIFSLAFKFDWGEDEKFAWIFPLGSFVWLICFFVFMANTFPTMFSLWWAAFSGAFFGIVIGVVLFIIYNAIVGFVGSCIVDDGPAYE